jgi:hypothetical protein
MMAGATQVTLTRRVIGRVAASVRQFHGLANHLHPAGNSTLTEGTGRTTRKGRAPTALAWGRMTASFTGN